MPKTTKTSPNFEQDLDDLEGIVQSMEKGDLSLEDALKQFEKGVALTRKCQTALQGAEQQVQVLLEKDGLEALEDFDIKDSE